MDETVRHHQNPDLYVTATLARWHAATTTFTWANCSNPHPYLAHLDGSLEPLESPPHSPLGSGPADRAFVLTQRRVASGERLILVTDGVTQRRTQHGIFGTDGIRRAIADLQTPTAATAAMAILNHLTNCWREPLQDDGTVVVLSTH